jgi:hypothetical protein
MYTLVFYKTALVFECLITRITNKRSFTTMNTSVSYQMALSTERLSTHITSVRAFTTMSASMCSQTTVFSESPITQLTCIWTLHPMNITGISAFSTVYVKVFIQSNLVKIQRLNIRITCDRKTIL